MIGTILGIDPGKSGGVAILFRDPTLYPHTYHIPDTLPDLLAVFQAYRSATSHGSAESFAYLELVHAMPGQGVSSTFKFGQNYGHLEMALVAARIPFTRVTPQTWQRKMGLVRKKGQSKTEHKNRLKAAAQELFPHVKVTLKTADALLIAEYGRRLKAGEL